MSPAWETAPSASCADDVCEVMLCEPYVYPSYCRSCAGWLAANRVWRWKVDTGCGEHRDELDDRWGMWRWLNEAGALIGGAHYASTLERDDEFRRHFAVYFFADQTLASAFKLRWARPRS